MSQRSMHDCINCDSVYIVTVVDVQEDHAPYCPYCGTSTAIKIEAVQQDE